MDHREFVSSLPPIDREALTRATDAPGLRHMALHLGAILAVSVAIAAGVPGWWALLPVQGVLIVFLFTLEHECTHRTAFESEALNTWVGRVCGIALVLPFEWFRYFHLAHHRWTNIPGKDPELDGTKPAHLRAWLWHVSGLPYWGAEAKLMAQLVRGRVSGDYLPRGAGRRIVAEARAMAAIYALAAISLIWSPLVIWLWLVPVLLGQPALRLYLLAEHGDCPYVSDMFCNTRTTFTNRLVRFLAWNMPYHVEHHVYPSVPFHRLPELHLRMQQHLQVTAPGYAAFTKDYLSRRL
ncbi:MAG: fatty acid desaturase [Paracoccaceae bacterium]